MGKARERLKGQLHNVEKKKHKKEKKRQRKEQKSTGPGAATPKRVPRTVENTRQTDATLVEAGDEAVAAEETQDEFAEHFLHGRPPHVLLTTSYKCTGLTYRFCADLMTVFPSATFFKRKGRPLKLLIERAIPKGFTAIVVVNEDNHKLNGMLVTHLPEGPTATFNLSSVVLSKDIPGRGAATPHKPELVLNNFRTHLGLRVGRLLGAMFCQDPTFYGRRVVTFHNQRDFIFFRHHRYVFEETDDQVGPGQRIENGQVPPGLCTRLQELGPRFTLKLMSVQKGTFDSRYGEYEWILKRGEMETNKKFFHL